MIRLPTLALLFAGMLSPVRAFAQDSTKVVFGYVANASTGLPVAGAAVRIGPRIGDTDSGGRVQLCRVPSEAEVVRIQAEAFIDTILSLRPDGADTAQFSVLVLPLPVGESRRIRITEGPGPNSHRAIVVVDGERMFANWSGCATPPPGQRRVDQVDPASIRSVELLKGPAAVQRFGPDAVHGAIMITTAPQPSAGEPAAAPDAPRR